MVSIPEFEEEGGAMVAEPLARPVLFDVGGVLVNSHPDPAYIAELIGDGSSELVSLVDQAMWANRDAYDAGASDRDFWDRVSGDCGQPQVSDDVLAKLVEHDSMRMHDADPEAVALIDELAQAGARLGILSNAPRPIADQIRRASWAKAFTSFVFSCDAGSCKPHRQIYRESLEAFEVDPADVIFFDDRKKNIRAAQLLGIHGILWTGAAQAREDLKDLGILA